MRVKEERGSTTNFSYNNVFSMFISNALSIPSAISTLMIWYFSSIAFYYRSGNNPDTMLDPTEYVSCEDTLVQCIPDLFAIWLIVSIIFTLLDVSNGARTPRRIIAFLKKALNRNADDRIEDTGTYKLVPILTAKQRREKRASNDSEHPTRSLLLSLSFFTVMLVFWSIWIAAHAPGTVRDDTIPQLLQSLGLYPWYSQHPVFSSLVFGAFASIGIDLGSMSYGMFIYIVFQAVMTAIAMSYALHVLRQGGISYALIIPFIAFYALSRMVYQPIDSMGKDSLNSIFVLLAFASLIDIRLSLRTASDEKRRNEKRKRYIHGIPMRKLVVISIVFIVSIIVSILTKRTIGYIFIAFFVIMSIYDLISIKRHDKALLIPSLSGFITSLITIALLMPCLNASVGAESNKTFEMYSIPNQQMIYTVSEHKNDIDSDSMRRLSKAFDIDKAIDGYNPVRSDEVSATINPDNYSFIDLLPTYIELMQEYPQEYIDAFWRLSGGWFDIRSQTTFAHEFAADMMNEGRIKQWSGFFDSDVSSASTFLSDLDPSGGSSSDDNRSNFEIMLDSIDNSQSGIPFVSSLGLYAFVLPFIAIAYSISRRKWEALAMLSLSVLLFASLIVGPIALYWYVIPCVYLMPLIVALPAIDFS